MSYSGLFLYSASFLTLVIGYSSLTEKAQKARGIKKPIPKVTYEQSIFGNEQWIRMWKEINTTVEEGIDTSENARVKFYEFHGANNPSFTKKLNNDGILDYWRQKAKQSNTTFFTFSFMREPVSWSLSAYHMMCSKQGICQKQGKSNASSIEDLERLMQSNQQCGFFYRGGWY